MLRRAVHVLLPVIALAAALCVHTAWVAGEEALDAEPIRPLRPGTLPSGAPGAPARIALGEALFNDVRLSHDNTRSCASCHDLRFNGASGRRRDLTPDGRLVANNTNTVFNAALSFRLDWVGDARTPEDQAAISLQSPDLMATSFPELLGKLRADPGLVARFHAAYGHGPDRPSVLDAIATYERTLITPGSRFDRWLLGDAAALSPEEKEGYQLFKAVGCVSCHQGMNVGGNLFEKNGVFRPLLRGQPEIIRVPSLRNVGVTPPYFHDGSAPTLRDAVQQMAKAQLGRSLSPDQVGRIVAFLNTLTGTFQGHPVSAPPP